MRGTLSIYWIPSWQRPMYGNGVDAHAASEEASAISDLVDPRNRLWSLADQSTPAHGGSQHEGPSAEK